MVFIEVDLIDEDVRAKVALRRTIVVVVVVTLQMISQHVAEDALVRRELKPTEAAGQLA